jgi:hypothetical protein
MRTRIRQVYSFHFETAFDRIFSGSTNSEKSTLVAPGECCVIWSDSNANNPISGKKAAVKKIKKFNKHLLTPINTLCN